MKEFRLSNNTIDFIINSLEESIMEEGTLEEIMLECLNDNDSDLDNVTLYDYILEVPLETDLTQFVLRLIRKVEDYLKSHKGEKGVR